MRHRLNGIVRIPTMMALVLLVSFLVGCGEDLPPPNILWISVEDISPHLGSYGDPHANTPRLDALAGAGVRYTNAFAVAGVCAPSRSAIITGMYPTSLGTHHMRTTGRLPDAVKGFPAYLREAGYYTTNNVKTDYNFVATDEVWDASSTEAHWRNRPDPNQPFFAVINLTMTHESRISQDERYEQAVSGLEADAFADPAALPLPPYYPDTPVVREDWARLYNIIAAMDRKVGQILGDLEDDGLADNTIVFFFSDHGDGLPRAKRWVYDTGIRVPLIVYAPPAYAHLLPVRAGEAEDELVSLLDLGPTTLKLAGVPVPAHMQGRALLGADGAAPRDYIYAARDRMDERYDIIRAVRDGRFKYIRNYEPHKPYFPYMNTPEKGALMQALRRGAAAGNLPEAAASLFMATEKPVEELYDLTVDPYEIHNLSADPAYREVLERMRAVQAAWAADTRDMGLIPEPLIRSMEEAFDAPIYDLSADTTRFPMARIQEVAALPRVGKAALPELLAALGDAHPAVRYWGATGLGILRQDYPEVRSALQATLADDAPVVQVAAAWALGRTGRVDEALPVLTAHLQHDAEWLRLYVALALDDLGEQARPALSALDRALGDPNKYVVRVVNHALNRLRGTNHAVP